MRHINLSQIRFSIVNEKNKITNMLKGLVYTNLSVVYDHKSLYDHLDSLYCKGEVERTLKIESSTKFWIRAIFLMNSPNKVYPKRL